MNNLPSGWTLHSFMEILNIQGGSQPPKNKFIYEEKEGYVRFLQIRDFGAKPHETYIPISKANKTCNKDDILIARYGASIGRICTGMSGAYNVAMAKVIIPDNVYKGYVYYLLKSHIFQNVILGIERSAQDGFNKDDLEKIMLPFPATIDEQRRIVEYLEQLLSKLNATNERLDKIPALLKRFRQSVLSAACSGRLTADWRDGREFGTWEEKPLNEISDCFGGYAFKSTRFSKEGKNQVVRIGNIKNGYIDLSASPVFIDDEYATQNNRFKVLEHDLLISLTGTKYKRDYGNVALAKNEMVDMFLNQRVAILRTKEAILPKMLMLLMNMSSYRDYFFSFETGNVNQGNVGMTPLREAAISVPPLPEQEEIVRRVDKLFATADSIEASYSTVRQKLARAERSIYAKAFRGEL